MQVSIETLGTLGRKLTVSVPADQLETTIRQRLNELSRTVRLKGFRPGKVPGKVIEQRYGAQVRNEAVGELIQRSFSQAVQQENLRPAVQPAIETTGQPEDGEFKYTATFEVMPEIGKIDVSALKITRPVAEVADADIDRMIETLRQQRRTWEDVQRAAAMGDLVMFESVTTTDAGRIPAEGVDRSGTILGSGGILIELENQLVGLSPGDERELDVTFPADYRNAALAGRAVKIAVKIVRVSEARLPELDGAFFSAFGIENGDLEQFRDEVRSNLARELKGALMMRLKNDVVNKLLDAHKDLELPSRMIEAEARGLAQQAAEQARQRGQNVPEQISVEPFLAPARQRVAAAVLLGELARQNDIRLDTGRLQEMMQLIASTYEEPEQVIELYRRDPQLLDGLRSRVVEDQVIDWIADHADASTTMLSFEEVMQPGAAA
ncbi:trigger factor [Xanthomonadaceae bacterium JHOS43]|nr:trigger factor [Xanthomonadaceae bacterium JHOS43]MCX7563674.1 trigger factor [Xanthomonadaceae bacterium XH05]